MAGKLIGKNHFAAPRVSSEPIFLGEAPAAIDAASPDTTLGQIEFGREGIRETLYETDDKLAAIDQDPLLSEAGKREAAQQYVRGVALPRLAELREKVYQPRRDQIRQQLAELRPVDDPADSVAQLGDMEARTFLRSLTPEQRDSAISDGRLLAAALRAPPALSGFGRDRLQALRQRGLEKRYGTEKLREIEERDQAVDALGVGLDRSAQALRMVVALDPSGSEDDPPE